MGTARITFAPLTRIIHEGVLIMDFVQGLRRKAAELANRRWR